MQTRDLFIQCLGLGRSSHPLAAVMIVAALVGAGLSFSLGARSLFTLAFALFFIGIFEVNKAEERGVPHDDPSIVLDEAVGVWIAQVVALTGSLSLSLPYAPWIALFLSPVLFALFRLWRPSTIGWIHRNLQGGLGVMLDDLLCGLAAGILNLLILIAAGKAAASL